MFLEEVIVLSGTSEAPRKNHLRAIQRFLPALHEQILQCVGSCDGAFYTVRYASL